ncbi:MAG: hypothetical protein M3O67_01340 [Bacteroidota bacterium]|nr:hypothetical protein [Bacteroidota bacterium]
MKQNEKNKNTNKNVLSESFSDEVTDKKIDRHLNDINDTISDDDIKNVKVSPGTGDTTTAGNEEKTVIEDKDIKNASIEEKSKEAEEAKKIITPWNLLDE